MAHLWTMGEGINVVRDMSNPPASSRPQPDTYGGQHWVPLAGCVPAPANDRCGVHTNMGVPNKMFYLLSVGGTHPYSGITVMAIGINKAIGIAMGANRPGRWSPRATFLEARRGMIVAATEFYGAGSPEVQSVKDAWDAVGVWDCVPCE